MRRRYHTPSKTPANEKLGHPCLPVFVIIGCSILGPFSSGFFLFHRHTLADLIVHGK
jgi:hypothetical protein